MSDESAAKGHLPGVEAFCKFKQKLKDHKEGQVWRVSFPVSLWVEEKGGAVPLSTESVSDWPRTPPVVVFQAGEIKEVKQKKSYEVVSKDKSKADIYTTPDNDVLVVPIRLTKDPGAEIFLATIYCTRPRGRQTREQFPLLPMSSR